MRTATGVRLKSFGAGGATSFGFMILISLMLALAAPSRADDAVPLELTNAERTWLDQHPDIRVSNEMDWPPFDFVRNGKPAGFSIDYLKLLAKKAGFKIRFVNGYKWGELVNLIRNKELDILHSMSRTTEREAFVNFTHPFMVMKSVFFGRQDEAQIDRFQDLKGKRIAVVSDWASTKLMRKHYPDYQYVEFSSALEALRGVSEGRADVFGDTVATTNYLIDQNFLPGLKVMVITNFRNLILIQSCISVFARTGLNFWRLSKKPWRQ